MNRRGFLSLFVKAAVGVPLAGAATSAVARIGVDLAGGPEQKVCMGARGGGKSVLQQYQREILKA